MRTALVALIVVVLPASALAQAGAVVAGRVTDQDGAGIQNAVVTLEGLSPTPTSFTGAFRFVSVELGTYTLRITAIGYTPVSRSLVVTGDTTLTVIMEAVAFELDTVFVVAKEIDLEGRVQDPDKDLRLMGADVLTNEGHRTQTNAHGQFSLDVLEEVEIIVAIRAFGYLPLDTLLLPEEDKEYVFDLAVDSLVARMIAVEVARLEDRARPQRAVAMRPMNREQLLRHKAWTLLDLLRGRYYGRIQRVSCILVDEEELVPMTARHVLQSTLVAGIERIEFLFRGKMLRVYTRDFMREMLGGGLELRRPSYTDTPSGPFCT